MAYKAEGGAVLADGMLDEMAREYEEGTWSGHEEVSAGRPEASGGDMETASFGVPTVANDAEMPEEVDFSRSAPNTYAGRTRRRAALGADGEAVGCFEA